MKGLFLKLLFLLIVTAQPLFAQDRTIEINVSGSFRPVGSQGILITPQGVINKPVLNVANISRETMVVSIPYKPAEIAEGAFATAVLFGPDGEAAFGDVKTIVDSPSTKSFYTLPECQAVGELPPGLEQQSGLLESLVAIRAARREGHQLRLNKALEGPFLEKLKRLEKGFGLRYEEELSKDLHPFKLVDRLSRLTNAIKNYQSAKK